ncbi:MAG: hypothetical protein Q9163_003173 [Psora crenata]
MASPTSSPDQALTIPLPALFTHTTPPPTLLAQGAEALLYHTHFLTRTQPAVLKYRPPKPYRHPTLDRRLTRHRILSEARTLVKCRREGVSVPGVLALDVEGSAGQGGWMMMEYIGGKTVREILQSRAKLRGGGGAAGVGIQVEQQKQKDEEEEEGMTGLMGKIGRAVGRLHEIGVVHGDLTTSNMMLRPTITTTTTTTTTTTLGAGEHPQSEPQGGEQEGGAHASLPGDIVLIDFGLAVQSLHDEDKAVDLYVLERAFGSTHPEAEEGFREVLRVYAESYKGAKVVVKRLEDVRMRGRKRSMVG